MKASRNQRKHARRTTRRHTKRNMHGAGLKSLLGLRRTAKVHPTSTALPKLTDAKIKEIIRGVLAMYSNGAPQTKDDVKAEKKFIKETLALVKKMKLHEMKTDFIYEFDEDPRERRSLKKDTVESRTHDAVTGLYKYN